MLKEEEFRMNTAVAFIVFNRPKIAAQVFERIRQARPPKLFIIADGPRDNVPGEAEAVAESREFKNKVDWNCEVYTNFSEKNLGCKVRVVSGISWAFEYVDEIIILEDDCVPNLSFFRFCQELLEKYRYDNRIMNISGDNMDSCEYFDDSYGFTKGVSGIWGWATWKRVWKNYDPYMKIWPQFKQKGYLKNLLRKTERHDLEASFQQIYDHPDDGWDFAFVLHGLINHGLGIAPKVNLVRNIGYEPGLTTHIAGPKVSHLYMDEEIQFPLKHPSIMSPSNILRKPLPPFALQVMQNLDRGGGIGISRKNRKCCA